MRQLHVGSRTHAQYSPLRPGRYRSAARALVSASICLAMCVCAIGVESCAVSQSISVQRLDASAPIAAPPIRVVDHPELNSVIFSPHLNWSSPNTLTGILEYNETGTPYPTTHRINNFTWNLPKMGAGLNADIIFSRHTALGLGFNLSSLDGQTYGSWSASIGFFSQKENEAVRFDMGVQSTPVVYSAVTRIISTYYDKSKDTVYYYDNGQESPPTIFASLMLNTTRKAWVVNLFLNAYLTKERFIDFVPGFGSDRYDYANDSKATASQWIIGLTPGVYVPLMEDVRLVIGERIIFPFDIVGQDPYPLMQLHAQVDITM